MLFRSKEERFETAGTGEVVRAESLGPLIEGLAHNQGTEVTITCIVREYDQSARVLREKLPTYLRWQVVSGHVLDSIACIALRAYQSGSSASLGPLDACYIRRLDAEINWAKMKAETRSQ